MPLKVFQVTKLNPNFMIKGTPYLDRLSALIGQLAAHSSMNPSRLELFCRDIAAEKDEILLSIRAYKESEDHAPTVFLEMMQLRTRVHRLRWELPPIGRELKNQLEQNLTEIEQEAFSVPAAAFSWSVNKAEQRLVLRLHPTQIDILLQLCMVSGLHAPPPLIFLETLISGGEVGFALTGRFNEQEKHKLQAALSAQSHSPQGQAPSVVAILKAADKKEPHQQLDMLVGEMSRESKLANAAVIIFVILSIVLAVVFCCRTQRSKHQQWRGTKYSVT